MSALKPYEAMVDQVNGRVRYSVVYAHTIQEAYQAAKAQLAPGENMRGVTELDPVK